MPKLRMLPGEEEARSLRPHPLSFMPQYFVAAFPALLGLALFWLYSSDRWQDHSGNWFTEALFANIAVAYLYPMLALAVMGVIVAVTGIRWKVFFGYMALGLVALVTAGAMASGMMNDKSQYVWTIPVALFVFAIPGILGTELYRRSHHYTLTNMRIVFSGGFFVKHERQIKYEHITDLDGKQGILGRLFGFGTITPITKSGFGLGSDNSMAMMGMGIGGDKGGMGAGIGVAAGGGKEVNVARARTYDQLTGVRPYKQIKYLLETLIQEASTSPYLRQQLNVQQQMLGTLQHMQHQGGMPGQHPMPQPMPQQPFPPQFQQSHYPPQGHPQGYPQQYPGYGQQWPQQPPMLPSHAQQHHDSLHGRIVDDIPHEPHREESRGWFGRRRPEPHHHEPVDDPVFTGTRIR